MEDRLLLFAVVKRTAEMYAYMRVSRERFDPRIDSLIYTVWPEIYVGNLFWRIGGSESNPSILHPPKNFTV